MECVSPSVVRLPPESAHMEFFSGLAALLQLHVDLLPDLPLLVRFLQRLHVLLVLALRHPRSRPQSHCSIMLAVLWDTARLTLEESDGSPALPGKTLRLHPNIHTVHAIFPIKWCVLSRFQIVDRAS